MLEDSIFEAKAKKTVIEVSSRTPSLIWASK